MALDPNVIVLGEDIADGRGRRRRRRHQGAVDQVRRPARALHADRRAGDHRRGHRRGHRRHAAGGRDHADELHHGGDGHDRQPRGQAALHVRRPDTMCRSTIRTMTGGRLRHRRPARRLPRGLVRPHRRHEGGGAVDAGRCLRPDAVVHLRRRPVPVHREHADLLESRRHAGVRPAHSVGQGQDRARRQRCHADQLQPARCAIARGGYVAKENISVEVIDLRTIAPWDKATVLSSVAKTGRAVITHEAVKPFGVGAEISSVIHEEYSAS